MLTRKDKSFGTGAVPLEKPLRKADKNVPCRRRAPFDKIAPALALLFLLPAFAAASTRTMTYERALQCVHEAVEIARARGEGIAPVMMRKLDRDMFTRRVMLHQRVDHDFASYRARIDTILREADTGTAFSDVNLDSITFSPRKSRIIDLRLNPDRSKTRVVELVGSYATLQRREQRDDRGRAPVEYDVVLWIAETRNDCALVDLAWSNIRWSRHILELK